jgi:hypothetical protein
LHVRNGAGTRWWIVLAIALAVASAAALSWRGPAWEVPAMVRDVLSGFVQPGVIVWWLVLGGPFRTLPHSASHIAFAAAVNALFWWLAVRLVTAAYDVIRRRLVSPRS